MHYLTQLCLIGLVLAVSACATTGGENPEQQRESIQSMKREVLTNLYQVNPDARAQIEKAPGYAVFSNANVTLGWASFGGGYGVAKDNSSGKYTYMEMGELGLGLGLGVKDFRVVFVFHSVESMNNFIENGWAFGAQADAAAKASDQGGAVGGEVTLKDMTIYQLTESGLALQATIKGTKYWKDEELN